MGKFMINSHLFLMRFKPPNCFNNLKSNDIFNTSRNTVQLIHTAICFSLLNKRNENIDREIPKKNNESEHLSHSKINYNSHKSSYCEEEVNKFAALSSSWWDTEGEFKPLHSLNKLRVAFIRDGLLQSHNINPKFVKGPYPLSNLRLLDVGCGGGILCEPLARLGAEVIGIDAASENITVATMHAQKNKNIASNVRYIHCTIEDHFKSLSGLYDGIIASELIEHVNNLDYFIESCTSCLKPGGSLFFTTINRTLMSWMTAIVMAEYVLGLLPRGTHNYNKFVTPKELTSLLESAGCTVQLLHGMTYVPLLNKWVWISDSSVNYALHATKTQTS